MQKTWTPPLWWVFAAATPLVFFSTLQSYRLYSLNLKVPMDIEVGKLFILHLAYWYVPVALTPTIFRLAHRFRIDSAHWARALLAHAFFATAFSIVHCACMVATRMLLWENGGKSPYVSWATYLQRQYLPNLDW